MMRNVFLQFNFNSSASVSSIFIHKINRDHIFYCYLKTKESLFLRFFMA